MTISKLDTFWTILGMAAFKLNDEDKCLQKVPLIVKLVHYTARSESVQGKENYFNYACIGFLNYVSFSIACSVSVACFTLS